MTRIAGTVILILGVLISAYGGVAFFVLNSLPPNGGANGRLPSLYLLLGGLAVLFVGTVIRGLQIGPKREHGK